MATDRFFVCASCGNEEWAGGLLFEVLRNRARGEPAPCACGGQRYFKVTFPFARDAGRYTCKVVHAFLPEWETKWPDRAGGEVTFYPFLIIGESLNGKNQQTAWLPYWHITTYADGRTMQTRYGQWAPHMDADIFANLVDQARRAGLLV
jgi:hypothetical protein